MLLSEAEKDSGIVPGPVPAKIRYNRDQAMRSRVAATWRRQSLGADYVPLDQQGFSFADNSISQPTANFMTQIPSVESSIQPYMIQAPTMDFTFDPSSIQMPTLPDLSIPANSDTYSPQWSSATYNPPLPDFSAPDIIPPSFSTPDQKPANPAPAGSSTDWLTKALQIATVGAQTYTAVNAAQRPYTSPGVYVPGVTQAPVYAGGYVAPGVTPGVPVGAGLTAAQIAAMTPAQRVQYASMYPQASYPGVSAGGAAPSSTDFVGQLFGGMDTSKMLLWGGAGLLLTMLLMRRPQNA